MDANNILRAILEVKQKYALSASQGELYTRVQPGDIGKGGGDSAARSVRQVYNYMSSNGGSHI